MSDKTNMDKDENLKEISRHFDKMSSAIHQFSEVYKENTHRLPFIKTRHCWSLIVVLGSLAVGFSSLYFMGVDALSLVKAYNMEKEIVHIRKFKAHEERAISAARITVVNQTVECPVTDVQRLKQMKIERNKSLINIMGYNSGLNVAENKAANVPLNEIIKEIYDIGIHDICSIEPEKFDKKVHKKESHFDKITKEALSDRDKQLKELRF